MEVKELHPKSIVRDVEKLGAKLSLVEGELILEKPDNVPEYFREMIQESKVRVIAFLDGSLDEKQHAIDLTVDRLFKHWRNVPQDGTEIIQQWVDEQPEIFDLLSQLSVELAENGWKDVNGSFIPYETNESKRLAAELYEKAMTWKKRGAAS